MHRFEQRKRPVEAVPSALAKNKHQAVWVKTVPLLFCVRCSSFPDRLALARMKIFHILYHKSSRENYALCWQERNHR